MAKDAAKVAEIEGRTNGEDPLAWYINKNGSIRPDYKAVYVLVQRRHGRHLAFDPMTAAPCVVPDENRPWEVDPIDDELMSDIQLELAGLRCDARRDTVERAVDAIAHKNKRNSVESYLRALPEWCGKTDRIPYVVSEVMGITEANGYTNEQVDLYTIYLRKWLRSAVARAFEPGCKADLMLVFSGTTQGQYKSSFARALVPVKTWCGVPDLKNLERDAVMAMRHHWINEVPEIEKGSFYKDLERWKAFLSCEADTFRPPYGRRVVRYPRASVLFGTSNKVQILGDPTGSRRFLCIPIRVPIRVDLLEQIRDILWAQIVAEYCAWVQRGRDDSECPWWLAPDEQRRQDVDATHFEVGDPDKEKLAR